MSVSRVNASESVELHCAGPAIEHVADSIAGQVEPNDRQQNCQPREGAEPPGFADEPPSVRNHRASVMRRWLGPESDKSWFGRRENREASVHSDEGFALRISGCRA
jgi:hypothetical protein